MRSSAPLTALDACVVVGTFWMLVTVPVGSPFSVTVNVVVGNPGILRLDGETVPVENCPLLFVLETSVVTVTGTVAAAEPLPNVIPPNPVKLAPGPYSYDKLSQSALSNLNSALRKAVL
jgi:hypothetical protein